MSLRFTRLKGEMAYFENEDSLTIESFLDLMVDLYRDVEDGIGVDPENCACDDSDALATNLIWLGTQFQQICRNYERDIARSGVSDRAQLNKVSCELERELNSLREEKQACEDMQVQAAAKEKEKRRLEGEIALLKQKMPELKALENQNRVLEQEKNTELRKWDAASGLKKTLTEEIDEIRENIKKINQELENQVSPKLELLRQELKERQEELDGLNEQILLDDERIRELKGQIEDLRQDIENSDKQSILRRLKEKNAELEREKEAIAEAGREILRCEGDIRAAKEMRAQKEAKREEKQNEWRKLEVELANLEAEFGNLIAAEAQYAGKKRRYNSLKTSAEQLRKDSVLLGKRTGMEAFSLEEELDRAMSAIGNYLTGVEEAIKKYSSQTESVLQGN